MSGAGMTRRLAAVGVLVAALVVVFVIVARSGSDDGLVRADLRDAGGLKNGSNVRLDGAPVGRVQAIDLDESGIVHVTFKLAKAVTPLGADAKVLVQSDDLFGERYLQLTRGNSQKPLAGDATIPTSQTGVSVRLDDVVDALDMSTRTALETFLKEQGGSVVGRGKDLASTLEALPASLQDTGRMLAAFGSDTAAIGRLVEESDRVVAAVDTQRPELGTLVGSANAALGTLASRRRNLGATVRTAPGTLRSAQATLAQLRATAKPLAPAADGLRTTAPILTRTLKALPGFTDDALPTLATAASVSPELTKLGTQASPIVRRLKPLATSLSTYAQISDPGTKVLDENVGDVFGLMEGWSRSTQPVDAASHIFRFGETVGTDFVTALKPTQGERAGRKQAATPARRPGTPSLPSIPGVPSVTVPEVRIPRVTVPGVKVPRLPKVRVPGVPAPVLDAPTQQAEQTLDGLLEGLTGGG